MGLRKCGWARDIHKRLGGQLQRYVRGSTGGKALSLGTGDWVHGEVHRAREMLILNGGIFFTYFGRSGKALREDEELRALVNM